MSNDITEATILRHSETISIARESELERRVNSCAKGARGLSTPGLLHLARAAPLYWTTFRFIAWRKSRHQKSNVSREVVRVGPKSAHRSKRAVGQNRFGLPC